MGETRDVGDRVNEMSHAVIGAAIEVHRVLGPGFLEAIYEESLCTEFQLRGIPFARQQMVAVTYKGKIMGEGRIDMLVGGVLVVELKAVEALAPIHSVQLLSYLRATGHELGLLINFNVSVLRDGIKRVALTR